MAEVPRIIAPALTETWAVHFASRSWTTPRAQINAGYPILIQPTAQYGTWSKVVDYGTVVPTALIRLSFTRRDVFGSLPVVIRLGFSADSISWTEETDVQQIYGSNFRYVRVTLEFGVFPSGTPMGLLVAITVNPGGTPSDKDLISIEDLRVRLDVREFDDGGIFTANASDVTGTSVIFNKTFIDVRDLVVTPLGLDSGGFQFQWATDFTDAPNPTGFKVLVWDHLGARATTQVSWAAKGV